MLFASAISCQFMILGVIFCALPSRSLRTMTTTTPAGPIFFCAPAMMAPNFVTSYTSDRMFEDISATRGTWASGRFV